VIDYAWRTHRRASPRGAKKLKLLLEDGLIKARAATRVLDAMQRELQSTRSAEEAST
jgi:hypothetical protein